MANQETERWDTPHPACPCVSPNEVTMSPVIRDPVSVCQGHLNSWQVGRALALSAEYCFIEARTESPYLNSFQFSDKLFERYIDIYRERIRERKRD